MGILDKIKKGKTEEQAEEKKTAPVKATEKTEATEKTTKAKSTKSKKVAEKKEVVPKGSGRNSKAYSLLQFPFVSEKAADAEQKGVYTFVVSVDADKESIKSAVESIYGVRPDSVRTMNMEGKSVRFGLRRGRRKSWKKAIVTLPKGKSISIHEGV